MSIKTFVVAFYHGLICIYTSVDFWLDLSIKVIFIVNCVVFICVITYRMKYIS